jgi:hypothetical protein
MTQSIDITHNHNSTSLNDHELFYYVPEVPSIKSTTRYNHSKAISNLSATTTLITHKTPPEKISQGFNSNYVLGNVQSIKDIIGHARKARRIVNATHRCPVIISTFNYAQVIAGWISDAHWIVDIFDDPHQQVIHKPAIEHWIGVRVVDHLLQQADTAIYTLHPAIPRTYGKEQRFCINGASTSIFSQHQKEERQPLRCVWVGKTKPGFGICKLIKSLKYVHTPIQVDVYGKKYNKIQRLSENVIFQGKINFHGRVDHETVTDGISKAHLGLCLLNDYPDFKYAYPIKIGEYLAGGAIPIASDFPGIRRMCKGIGSFPELTTESIADRINELADIPRDKFDQMVEQAQNRAQIISWQNEREKFSRAIVDSIKKC